LRKPLVATLATLTALTAGGAAIAQTPETGAANITVSVSPSKVGTKKKPKPAKLTLEIRNGDSSQTANRIRIYMPKQLRTVTKGLKKCSQSKLEQNLDPTTCPKASRLGSGTAQAIAGVNTSQPSPLGFNVTAVLLSSKKIGFLIQQQGGEIATLAVGTLKKASGRYGQMLDVSIPQLAREYPPGSYNGLVGLKTTLYKKVGKRSLLTTRGCTSQRTLPFKTILSFQNNPNPPKAATVEAVGTADCRK
jgi:hypothetical protein